MAQGIKRDMQDAAADPNEKQVIFADFDNTQLLTKDQKAVKSLENIRSMLALRYLVNMGGLNLVHCTGRVGAQIIRDIEDGKFSGLPFAVASRAKTIIAGVGTEIYHLDETGQYVVDEEWQQKMRDTGFTEAVGQLLTQDGYFQKDFLASISEKVGADIELAGQEPDKQTDFKQSMWGNPQDGVTSDAIRNAMIEAMEDRGVDAEAFSITVSVQTSKIAIDLTPKGATKPEACEYLMARDNIQPHNVIMAGDSGNDTHLTNVPGVKVSIPSNGQNDLIEQVWDKHPDERNIRHDTKYEAAAGLIESAKWFGHVSGEQINHAYNKAKEVLKHHYSRSGPNWPEASKV